MSSTSVQHLPLPTERFLLPLFQPFPSAYAPAPAVPRETMTRKKGKAVMASKNIPIKLGAVGGRSIKFMWWSVEIIAHYFIVIFMPAGPTLNCVPDSWPSFFRMTMVTPLSFFIDMAVAPPAIANVAWPAP